MKKELSFGVKNKDKEEEKDPLGLIMEQGEISASQESVLPHQPFVGEQVNDGEDSPFSSSPASSILMLSVSETQQPDDFLTPLDKSLSLPTSADDDDQLVDLGRDSSDLGFPHQQPGSLPHHREGINLNPPIPIPIPAHNFKGESDSSLHLPMESLNLSHPNPDPVSDSDSLNAATLGVQSHENKANEKLGSASKPPFSNVEQVSGISTLQNKKISSASSAATVFDVLKALSDDCGGGDDDEESEDEGEEDLSLLDAFKKSGLTFPRPRWWPENDNNFKNSRIV